MPWNFLSPRAVFADAVGVGLLESVEASVLESVEVSVSVPLRLLAESAASPL